MTQDTLSTNVVFIVETLIIVILLVLIAVYFSCRLRRKMKLEQNTPRLQRSEAVVPQKRISYVKVISATGSLKMVNPLYLLTKNRRAGVARRVSISFRYPLLFTHPVPQPTPQPVPVQPVLAEVISLQTPNGGFESMMNPSYGMVSVPVRIT